jgi:hypothetical protein
MGFSAPHSGHGTVSSGNSVLQKGHFFCLIPAMVGIFLPQFGHGTGFDKLAGLKHISINPP